MDKKIVVIAETAHPKCIGGIETFERNLQEILKKNLTFIAYPTKKEKIFKVENIEEVCSLNIFFRILNKLLKNEIRYYLVRKKIKELNPNICILRMPYNIDFIENKNIKTILVQHSAYEVYRDYHFKQGKNLVDKLKKRLDCFVFLSEYDRQRFVNEIGFPIEKTAVIRHTSNIELLKEKKNRKKSLIMLARISNKEKRFDLVIEAMKKLSDYSLDIYGEGEDKEKLQKLILEKNLNNVFFHNGTNEVAKKLDKSAIFIMTSAYEGYPISCIEAMRRGLPIILRDTFTSAKDIVIGNGILLGNKWDEEEFVQAVKNVYENYDNYSQKSIELGKRYDYQLIQEQWKKLIENI